MDNITSAMKDFLDYFYPKHRQNPNSTKIKLAWWTSNIQKEITKRKTEISTFQQSMTLTHYIQAKHQIAHVKLIIRQAKRDNWKTKCSQLYYNTNSRTLWNTIKWFTGKSTITSTPITYDQYLQYQFLKHTAPDTTHQQFPHSPTFSTAHIHMHLLIMDVTHTELKSILDSYKKNCGRV